MHNSVRWMKRGQFAQQDPLAGIWARLCVDSIARLRSQIVKAMKSGSGTQQQAVAYSQSPEAHELFLKARDYLNRSDPRTGGTLAHAREAITLYEQAVKADPKFALAFVELAR